VQKSIAAPTLVLRRIARPIPFPVRSKRGVGKPDGPSRLARSNLLPPVPNLFGGDHCSGGLPRAEAQWGDCADIVETLLERDFNVYAINRLLPCSILAGGFQGRQP
jgi:hypothetical protein